MSEFKQYRRKQIAELRPYVEGENLSPRDMIARNPINHDDQWLITSRYFEDNFEPMEQS